MPQDDNASLFHNTHTRHAGRIRGPATPATAEPYETAGGSTAGRQNRLIKSHPRTIARSITTRTSAAPPPLPVIPTRRERGMPNKFKESTIHEITKGTPRNIEKIAPAHTIPPWRTGAQDKQYTLRLTTNPARRGITKAEAADGHWTRHTTIAGRQLHHCIHRRINEGEGEGEPDRSRMGTILERNGKEERKRGNGETR